MTLSLESPLISGSRQLRPLGAEFISSLALSQLTHLLTCLSFVSSAQENMKLGTLLVLRDTPGPDT